MNKSKSFLLDRGGVLITDKKHLINKLDTFILTEVFDALYFLSQINKNYIK